MIGTMTVTVRKGVPISRPSAIPKYLKHSSRKVRLTVNGRDYLLGPWKSKTSFDTLKLIPSLKAGRTVAPDTEPVTPVDDVVEATVKSLSPIVPDMVMMQRLIGCRPGEVCNLTPASFDRSDDVWIATRSEVSRKEMEFILLCPSNDPQIG